MSPEATFEVTLQDLRAIIHGLKMASLSFVEEKALTEINAMIKSLPGPEEINILEPGDVKALQSMVGKIMRLIELYGKRDMEFKTRYKARTGLPPRYKVLDWRVPMEQKARDITRSMIKTSSIMDDIGHGDIAGRLIKCAQKVQSNDIDELELAHITADTLDSIGFKTEASLIRKEAQTIELGVEDITGGLQQIYQSVDGVINSIKSKTSTLGNVPTARKAVQLLENIWSHLEQFKKSLNQPITALEQETPAIEQALEGVIPKEVFDKQEKKRYTIEWTEQDSQGEQTAYVTKADGQKYEVQRDESGFMSISPEPMRGTQSTQDTMQLDHRNIVYDDATIKKWIEDMDSQGMTIEQMKAEIDKYPTISDNWKNYPKMLNDKKLSGMTEETSGQYQGAGSTTTTLQPPDISNLTPKSIDAILNQLGVAAKVKNKISRIAELGLLIPQEIQFYLNQIQNDEQAKSKFVEQLKKRKQEVGASQPTSSSETSPEQVQEQPSNDGSELMNPNIGTRTVYQSSVFNLKRYSEGQ